MNCKYLFLKKLFHIIFQLNNFNNNRKNNNQEENFHLKQRLINYDVFFFIYLY